MTSSAGRWRRRRTPSSSVHATRTALRLESTERAPAKLPLRPAPYTSSVDRRPWSLRKFRGGARIRGHLAERQPSHRRAVGVEQLQEDVLEEIGVGELALAL